MATAEVHERLHQAAPFRAVADAKLARPDYSDLLGRIMKFHRTLDQTFEARKVTHLGSGHRIELLQRDLEYLSGEADRSVFPWAAPDCEGSELGCLYVAGGSALGGRIIYRQLDYLFGKAPEGRTFFAGSDDEPRRWRSLCLLLEQAGECDKRRAGMVAGAQAAFRLFETCLEQG